jgi:hypothetical protein
VSTPRMYCLLTSVEHDHRPRCADRLRLPILRQASIFFARELDPHRR